MSIWKQGAISIDWPQYEFPLPCDACGNEPALLLQRREGKEHQEIQICRMCLSRMAETVLHATYDPAIR